jgi:hypothetical protein
MEQTTATPVSDAAHAPAIAPSQENDRAGASQAPCATCGEAASSPKRTFVYALGRIEPRFASVGIEKEFAQVAGRGETSGLTDRQMLHSIVSKRENRYLARRLCWVLTIEGLETYILTPRDPSDLDLLIDAIRPAPSPLDLDLVVGVLGPIAPAEMCNGLMVPIVAFDHIYSFDRDTLIKSIPRPEKTAAKEFATAAGETLDRIMQMADNAGATSEHRALNYCAVRYPAIYARVASAYAQNASLTAVEVRPSSLRGLRDVVEVIFSFTSRETDVVEKFFVRVDVTEEFPFLVTKLSPYYDR